MMRATIRATLLVLFSAICAEQAQAHSESTGFLQVQENEAGLEAQWSVSLADLQEVLNLDSDNDGLIRWGEVRTHSAALQTVSDRYASFATTGKPCRSLAMPLRMDTIDAEPMVVISRAIRCSDAGYPPALSYTFLFDRNARHRAILVLRPRQGTARTFVLTPDRSTVNLAQSVQHEHSSATDFLSLGVEHILSGIDHLLFLATIVLAAILPHPRLGATLQSLRARSWSLAKRISLFTLAHSITLCLTALEVVAIDRRIVESGIAASILLMAVNYLKPMIAPQREGAFIFAFGLLHGMGFAAVLQDLMLPLSDRVAALLFFNVGVEIGQLAVVLLAVPVLAWAGQSVQVRRVLVNVSASVIASVGVLWLIERAFNLQLIR